MEDQIAVRDNWRSGSYQLILTAVIREVTMTLMRVRHGSCMTAIKKEITHNGETLKVISNVNKVMTVDYSSDFTRT
jgi:hypothetical protein